MEVLSKKEFRRRLLRDQGMRKLTEYKKKEAVVEAYLGQQKGKKKYTMHEW